MLKVENISESRNEMNSKFGFSEFQTSSVFGLTFLLLIIFCAEVSAKPLTMPGYDDLYQRVLTRENAIAFDTPEGAPISAAPLPMFSSYYVFKRMEKDGREWLALGSNPNRDSDMWVLATATENWPMMIVMQFAKAGQRERALFFDSADELRKLIESPRLSRSATEIVRSLDSQKPDGRLVAAETDSARIGGMTFDSKPYVFPVLSHKRVQFDNGNPATMIEVASVNVQGAESRRDGAPQREGLEDSQLGAMFVIDTTTSMRPYIDVARDAANDIAKSLSRTSSSENRAVFGLVGYRNNMDDEPRKSKLEYVTKRFVSMKKGGDAESLARALDSMQEATVSTHSFDEDLVAGLYEAIEESDWSGIDYRLVIVITDAGALPDGDPLSKYPQKSLSSVVALAQSKGIAIIPIHLHTNEARKVGNISQARRQHMILGRTGDTNNNKYVPISGGTPEALAAQFASLPDDISSIIASARSGRAVEKRQLSDSPSIGDLVVNEVFGDQQRLIGAIEGDRAPVFLRGWTVANDLTDTRRQTMQVAVLLSRNQLNELAQRLDRIYRAALKSPTRPEEFFANLQSLSAGTAQDPERFGEEFSNISESGLLPAYLELLPYKTEVLGLSRSRWLAMGAIEQQDFIDKIAFRLRIYRDIESSNKWVQFSAGDAGQEVYPVLIEHLP